MRVLDVIGHIKAAANITFIIGAGASKSAGIPLAIDLVKAINLEFSHCLTGLSTEDRANYGRAMGALSPGDRKRLIQPLLENAQMNWGHIALANVIKQANVRRVLSFNFDFLLEKASALLGEHLPVYDFGVSPTSQITGLADKAIFHLHGQSYGLKLLNSDEETTAHIKALRPLVSDSLRNHLTIVIGYSGEADAAFDLISDVYDSNYDLIWLGRSPLPKPHMSALFSKKFTHYVGDCDFDRTMIAVARGLGCWPPLILENPPRHVLEQISDLPDFPVSESEGMSVLSTTRNRLNVYISDWDSKKSDEEFAAEALISGVDVIESMEVENLSEKTSELRSWALIEEAGRLQDRAMGLEKKERGHLYSKAIISYKRAMKISPNIPQIYNNWGSALLGLSRIEDAPSKYDVIIEAIEKYKIALDLYDRPSTADFNIANAYYELSKLQHGDERKKSLNLACQHYELSIDGSPKPSEAYNNWGNAIRALSDDMSGSEKIESIKKACDKYKMAISLNPKGIRELENLSISLLHLSQELVDQGGLNYISEAHEQCLRALNLEPDNSASVKLLANILLEESRHLEGALRDDKLADAELTFRRAHEMGESDSYNFACLLALRGKEDEALSVLESFVGTEELPDMPHLESDADLDSIRGSKRYKIILEKAKRA